MLKYLVKHTGLSDKLLKSPDFIIAGAQKSGTTYLYNLLVQHKDILPSTTKEVHYFDNNINKGDEWYLSHFPFKFFNTNKITGESSPYYLYHPLAAERIYNFDNQIKIILLLRNPVDRAISHLNMIINRHDIDFNFEDFCNIENEIIIQKLLTEKLKRETITKSNIHQDFSFIQRGIYAPQVKKYMNYFKLHKNLLIIKSEDFFDNNKKTLDTIFDFLGVSVYKAKINLAVNNFSGEYNNNFIQCRKLLIKYYKHHNKELEDLLGLKMNWD